MKILKEAEYMAAIGFTLIPVNAFRSGLVHISEQRRLRVPDPSGSGARK
jgi:hypothetical protein